VIFSLAASSRLARPSCKRRFRENERECSQMSVLRVALDLQPRTSAKSSRHRRVRIDFSFAHPKAVRLEQNDSLPAGEASHPLYRGMEGNRAGGARQSKNMCVVSSRPLVLCLRKTCAYVARDSCFFVRWSKSTFLRSKKRLRSQVRFGPPPALAHQGLARRGTVPHKERA
jgi:hypothetical protein